MEFLIFLIIVVFIIMYVNGTRSGATSLSEEWRKSRYNWEIVSSYFLKMITDKLASSQEEEKFMFYTTQIMKIEAFLLLSKKSPPLSPSKFQRFMVDEADMILSFAGKSEAPEDNFTKACVFSAIIGQIAFSAENEHSLNGPQKIYPPVEEFFCYAYEATLKKFNLSPYKPMKDYELELLKNCYKK